MTGASPRARRPPRSRGKRYALVLLLIAALLGFLALGTWQVERRVWKLDLIERVGRRVQAPPGELPGPAEWPRIAASTDEYRHVRATGRYVPGADTAVQAVSGRGAGFWVLTPLRTVDGPLVLVNRGFVERLPPRPPAAGTVVVTGLLRLTEPGGGFLRRNDAAAGRWYSRDVEAIGRARGLGPVAPYFIDAEAAPGGAPSAPDDPVGGLTVVAFANNHLVYAITWYVLALMSLGALRQVVREARRADEPGGARA